jgi:transcriptional regulator with XRE-family HTH domain
MTTAPYLGKKVNVAKHRPLGGEELGRRVLALREALGLTQEQVADVGGIHRVQVIDAEKGRNRLSTERMRRGLAKGLGIAPDALAAVIDGSLSPEDAARARGRDTLAELPLLRMAESADSRKAATTALVKGDVDLDDAREAVDAALGYLVRRGHGGADAALLVDMARGLIEARAKRLLAGEQGRKRSVVPHDPPGADRVTRRKTSR